jgi:DNA-binding SARP family transcriptional activator
MDHQLLVRQETAATDHRSGGPEPWRLTLLGGFGLIYHDQEVSLAPGPQKLLAFLALHLRPLLRTYVAGSLWPDGTEARSAASLRSMLWRLRAVRPPVVRATSSHLCLADGLAVDAREVTAAVRRLVDRSTPCPAYELDPVRLTGELLPDWSADGWVLVERERLRQLCLHGLEAMAERLLALGRYCDAIDTGLAAVRGEPLRESAHRVLISAHLAEGNHWEALRQFRWYERILREELGIEPSLRMTQLVSDLRYGELGSPIAGLAGRTPASRGGDAPRTDSS